MFLFTTQRYLVNCQRGYKWENTQTVKINLDLDWGSTILNHICTHGALIIPFTVTAFAWHVLPAVRVCVRICVAPLWTCCDLQPTVSVHKAYSFNLCHWYDQHCSLDSKWNIQMFQWILHYFQPRFSFSLFHRKELRNLRVKRFISGIAI